MECQLSPCAQHIVGIGIDLDEVREFESREISLSLQVIAAMIRHEDTDAYSERSTRGNEA